jgi:hypothetical protein
MAEHGVEYGPAFRAVEQIWSGSGEAIGRLRSPGGRRSAPCLDACLQIVAAAFDPAGGTWLPAGVDRMQWLHPGHSVVWSHARVDGSRADLSLLDGEGRLVARIDGLRLQRLDAPERIDMRAGCTICGGSPSRSPPPRLRVRDHGSL